MRSIVLILVLLLAKADASAWDFKHIIKSWFPSTSVKTALSNSSFVEREEIEGDEYGPNIRFVWDVDVIPPELKSKEMVMSTYRVATDIIKHCEALARTRGDGNCMPKCSTEGHYNRFTQNGMCIEAQTCKGVGYADGMCACSWDEDLEKHCKEEVEDGQWVFWNHDTLFCQDEGANTTFLRNRKGLCSVEGVPIRPCKTQEYSKEILVWVLIGKKFIFPQFFEIRIIQHKGVKKCWKCTGGNVGDKCKGDSTYCDTFSCGVKKCECVFDNENPNCVNLELWDGHNWIVPTCLGTVDGMMGYEHSDLPVRKLPPSLRKLTEENDDDSCIGCDLTCKGQDLCFKVGQRRSESYQFRMGGITVTGLINGDKCVRLMPEQALVGGEVSAKLNFLEGDDVLMSAKCEPMDACELIGCYFCAEYLMSFKCLPAWLKILFVLVVVVFGIGLLIFCFFIRWVVKQCMLMHRDVIHPVARVSYGLTKRVAGLGVKAGKGVYNFATKEEPESVPLVEVTSDSGPVLGDVKEKKEESRPVRSHSKTHKRIPLKMRSLVSLTIIVIFLDCAFGCNEVVSFTVQDKYCQQIGTQTVCTISSTNVIKASPIGQSSCLKLKDGENEIGNIAVTLKDLTLRCQKQNLYFIPFFEVECASKHRCWKTDECNGNHCEEWPDEEDWGQNIIVTGNGNAGIAGCQRVRGGVGNDCASIQSGCLFYRSFLKSKSNHFAQIYTCTNWRFVAHVTINMYVSGKQISKDVELKAGEKAVLDHVEITLTGATSPPSSVVDMCFASYDGHVSMTPCNKEGEMTTGRVGDIQCRTQEAAEKATTDCSFNAAALETVTHDASVSCNWRGVDYIKIFKEGRLPKMYGDFSVIEEEGEPELVIKQESMLEITIVTDDFELVRNVEKGKCDARFVSISGCYGCAVGANISLTIEIEKTKEAFNLHCPSLSVSFIVDKKEKNYNQRVLTSEESLRESCVWRCGTSKGNLTVTGDLVYLGAFDPSKDQHAAGQVISVPGGFHLNFGSGLKSLFGTGIAILGLILILYIVFKCVIPLVKNRSPQVILAQAAQNAVSPKKTV